MSDVQKFNALWFEIDGIQSFIMDSGRLRDIIGASELVDQLTEDVLDACIKQLGLADDHFSRRAGGAFIYLSEDPKQIEHFAAVWSVVVSEYAPGLSFCMGIGQGATPSCAVSSASSLARQDRNQPKVAMPVAGPLVRRAPRTGQPAVCNDKGKEWIDLPTARKREINLDLVRNQERTKEKFPLKFGEWPRDLDEKYFPYLGEKRELAIVHIDGNGFGLLLRKVMAEAKKKSGLTEYAGFYREFSDLIADVTKKSTAAAIEEVIAPQIAPNQNIAPMRPLVLGGDDVTVLIRPDLAINFTKSFARSFEKQSGEQLRKFWEKHGIADSSIKKLTVGAGILTQGANQPFYMGYGLAEELCSFAKEEGDRHPDKSSEIRPSTVSFYRLTTASAPDWESICSQELTAQDEQGAFRLQYGGWLLSEAERHSSMSIERLEEFCEWLGKEAPRSAARQLLMLALQEPELVIDRFQRWQSLQDKKANAETGRLLEKLGLFGQIEPKKPLVLLAQDQRLCPLGDANTMLGMIRGVEVLQ